MRARTLAPLVAFVLSAAGPQDAVVRVRSTPGCLIDVVGSGVVVAPGIVVTNAHVIHGSQDILVQKDGLGYRVQAHILAPEYDLCLLRVPVLPTLPAVMAEELPVQGQALEAWGFPADAKQHPVLVQGQLATTWKYRDSSLLQVGASIRGGHSGGGLFLPDGRLVGITTFNLLGAANTHFAVPVTWVRELLKRPWIDGDRVTVCKPRSVLLHELLDRLTENPENRPPWEAFARAWVSSEPNQAEAWFALGHVLLARYQEPAGEGTPHPELQAAFEEAFRKAATLDPTHVRAWNNLGIAYHERGEFEKARQALQRALQVKPDYGLAWFNLSGTCVDLKQYPEAAEAARRSTELIPDHAQAWARLGACELLLGHLEPAEAALRIALRYRPFHRPWLMELAEIHFRRADMTAYADLKTRLAEHHPDALAELALREPGWKPKPLAKPRSSR